MEPDNGTTVSVALFKQTLRNALLALYFPPPEEQNGAYREQTTQRPIFQKSFHLSSVVVTKKPKTAHDSSQESQRENEKKAFIVVAFRNNYRVSCKWNVAADYILYLVLLTQQWSFASRDNCQWKKRVQNSCKSQFYAAEVGEAGHDGVRRIDVSFIPTYCTTRQ